MATPIVLSYGMGVESTAILLRWIGDPTSRDFPLDDLIVLTAQTGNEFADTARLVEHHISPLLADHGIRWVQVARRGRTEADGITVLADTRTPSTVHLAGAWRLSDELDSNGTVPASAGSRLCSLKFKGFALDRWIADELGDQRFTHHVGFNAEETSRIARDRLCGPAQRHPAYPLAEWGWDRQACLDYIHERLGVTWPKSCCVFCPFAGIRDGIDAHLQRLDGDLEYASLALNPRMTLFRHGSIIDRLTEVDPTIGVRLADRLDTIDLALFEVRRIFPHRTGDRDAKAPVWRAVHRLATGNRRHLLPILAAHADRHDVDVTTDCHGIDRVWIRHRAELLPTVEHFAVLAPAAIVDKARPGFDNYWTRLCAPTLFDSAPAM